MIHYVDKVDSADLSIREITEPSGWILLGFIMDPRTGLGRFRNFTISNYDLMKELASACATKNIDEIMAMPDVAEREKVYFEQEKLFKDMIQKTAKAEGNVIVMDLRGVDTIHAGNRFIMYTMFPEQNISVVIVDGKNKQNCAITVGYSVINRNAKINVGSMLLKYGGGGHDQVGTCQVPYDEADTIIADIVNCCKSN